MKRLELIDKLKVVAPALSEHDMVPVLSHFWFRGDRLMATNDHIAISTKLQTPFKGAVPGKVLLSLLQNSKAKEVSLEPVDKELHIKAAISRFKLGMLPPEDFMTVFDMPKATPDQQAVQVKSVPQFLEAIEVCMRSVTTDTSTPDQLGVTLIPKGKDLLLFSTDSATMSHVRVTLTDTATLKKRVILSGTFCRELLQMCAKKSFHLHVTDEYALATLSNSDQLFGKLIHSESPVAYLDIHDHHFSPKEAKNLVAVPGAMRLILERACVISDASRTRTEITVEGDRMKFFSKSPHGEVRDSMQIESHPPIRVMVEPKYLKAAYGSFDRMVVTEKCVIMVGNSNKRLYMVSATEN